MNIGALMFLCFVALCGIVSLIKRIKKTRLKEQEREYIDYWEKNYNDYFRSLVNDNIPANQELSWEDLELSKKYFKEMIRRTKDNFFSSDISSFDTIQKTHKIDADDYIMMKMHDCLTNILSEPRRGLFEFDSTEIEHHEALAEIPAITLHWDWYIFTKEGLALQRILVSTLNYLTDRKIINNPYRCEQEEIALRDKCKKFYSDRHSS